MKKVMLTLIALATIMVLPLGVYAKQSLSVVEASTKDSEDGKSVIKTYNIYVIAEDNEEVSKADVGFVYGAAITKFECAGAGQFKLEDQATTGERKATCKFAIPEEGTSKEKKSLVGTMTVTANKNAPDEECEIQYSFGGSTGKINPPTGLEIPYVVIIGGCILAAGVYVATRKKTALFKI